MAACRKLVEDLLGGDELLLFQTVHFPAGQNQPRDLAPIHVSGNLARVAVSHGELRVQRLDHGGGKSIDLIVTEADDVEAAAIGHVDRMLLPQREHLLPA